MRNSYITSQVSSKARSAGASTGENQAAGAELG
jgi:hypothetical protein